MHLRTGLDHHLYPFLPPSIHPHCQIMAQVPSHHNIVTLIGVVTRGEPWIIVLSFAEHGSLLSALKEKHLNGNAFSSSAKIRFIFETAAGMAHLSKYHTVHRDLATRNVLLATGYVCKIADFGMSRATNDHDHEYYRSATGGVFPAKWTAPEAMVMNGKYSQASDVWSMAIVAVEIYQDGRMPYTGLSNPEVMELVKGGKHHRQPSQVKLPRDRQHNVPAPLEHAHPACAPPATHTGWCAPALPPTGGATHVPPPDFSSCHPSPPLSFRAAGSAPTTCLES